MHLYFTLKDPQTGVWGQTGTCCLQRLHSRADRVIVCVWFINGFNVYRRKHMAASIVTIRKDLRESLQREREELQSELRSELAERLSDAYSSRFADPLDTADLSFVGLQESVGVGLVDIRRQELEKMLAAERKLTDGSYGICERCGGEISEQRLSALPSAIYCIKCAEVLEGGHLYGKRLTL